MLVLSSFTGDFVSVAFDSALWLFWSDLGIFSLFSDKSGFSVACFSSLEYILNDLCFLGLNLLGDEYFSVFVSSSLGYNLNEN